MHTLLLEGLASVAAMLVLRCSPFAAHVVFTRPGPGARAPRLVPLALWGLGVAILVTLERGALAGWIALGLGYYLLVSLAAPALSAGLGAGAITRAGLFAALCLLLLLLPGLLLPDVARFAFLMIGWELVLSTYSYCVETSGLPARGRALGPCLFFLLVNPTLLYTRSGVPCAATAPVALARTGLGIGAFGLGAFALSPLRQWLRLSGLPFETAPSIATGLSVGIAAFLADYAAHSGVASLHVGLMRCLGHQVPERYRYPWCARSPMDFWRRWNTYVRVWLEAYVFLPASLSAARRTRSRQAQALLAVAALVACGLLHDLYGFAARQEIGLSTTVLFLAGGGVLLLWRGLAMVAVPVLARVPIGWRMPGVWVRLCQGLVFLGVSAVWGQR